MPKTILMIVFFLFKLHFTFSLSFIVHISYGFLSITTKRSFLQQFTYHNSSPHKDFYLLFSISILISLEGNCMFSEYFEVIPTSQDD